MFSLSARHATAVAVVALAALSLTACASDPSPAPTKTSPSASPTATSPALTSEQVLSTLTDAVAASRTAATSGGVTVVSGNDGYQGATQVFDPAAAAGRRSAIYDKYSKQYLPLGDDTTAVLAAVDQLGTLLADPAVAASSEPDPATKGYVFTLAKGKTVTSVRIADGRVVEIDSVTKDGAKVSNYWRTSVAYSVTPEGRTVLAKAYKG